MALTAGTLSKVSIGSTTASLLSTAASGGTGPYTYQWYRSTTSGFTPGVASLISGATYLSLSDSDLTAGTLYYYKVVSTDTGAGSATISSAQLQVGTAPVQDPNQFVLSKIVGQTDLKFNSESIAVEIDSSEVTTLYPGQAVCIVDSVGGVPKVVAATANDDEVFGFINYDIKTQGFVAGDKCEISQDKNVMFLISTTPIARGAQVTLDVAYVGGVASAVSGKTLVGYTLDKAVNVGEVIRVKLSSPSFTVA